MTQLVLATTLYGAATVAAAIEAGALPAADRRVLLVANTTNVPELVAHLHELPAFAALRPHFTAVHSYNAAIAPLHPADWRPSGTDAIILERKLRRRWELGTGDVELVVESIQVAPALALAEVFRTSRITVYADGLMTYGPTRTRLGADTADRIRVVVHPDLVPGLRPALLTEHGVPSRPFDVAPLAAVLARLGAEAGHRRVDGAGPPAALVLGQYLAELGLLTPDVELALHARMILAARERHRGPVWFKAHPNATRASTERLARWAAAEGFCVTMVDPAEPVEALLHRDRPAFVVGCFSTALVTAVRLYDVPAATVGIDELLAQLRPFENGNRIPMTISAALLPDLERSTRPPALPDLEPRRIAADLQPLVDAVAFCMQPGLHHARAAATAAWLEANVRGEAERFFCRRRLTSLGLPGGAPIPLWRSVPPPLKLHIRRRVGRARRWARGVAGSARRIRSAF